MQSFSFCYSGSELEAMAEARNYYRWICARAGPYIGKKVIEVGAGVGTFASVLLAEGRIAELVLVEPARNLFPHLAERFAKDARVKVINGYLQDCGHLSAVDSLIAVNVIEHVADDQEFLRLAFESLVSRGVIILFAPALNTLYGTLDKVFEHHRRYSKRELSNKLVRAGFRLENIRFVNLPGVVTWFFAGKILRQKTIRPSQVRIYDRWVIPWVLKLEEVWEPPLGQSLMAIARKP